MEIALTIFNGDLAYIPVLEGEVSLSLERQGAPGQLKFNVMKDEIVNFQEGNAVGLRIDGQDVFYGFIFTKSRDKKGIISVTAYDQIRYLKNKDSMSYEDMTASEVISMIANDFRLTVGDLEDTGFPLTRVETDTSLMDIIQNALDETLTNTKKMYVLYDDCGKLMLKSLDSMVTEVVIDESNAGDFSYSSSIDADTYNQVKLVFSDEDEGSNIIMMNKNSEKINEWGVLQYTESVDSVEGAEAKADALMELYCHKTRNLSIKEAIGYLDVRAGSFVAVALNIGDIILSNLLLVESCTHRFTGSEHFMDLTLRGGDFS